MTDFALAGPTARVSHRTLLNGITLLLVLPTVLLAAGFQPAPAALVLAGALAILLMTARDPSEGTRGLLAAPIDLPLLAAMTTAGALLLILVGELHLFYAPYDWRIRDAVLADLTAGRFPIGYAVAGQDYVLRAPLGMYMVPALVGRATGLMGAHVALWLQNSLLLGSVLYFTAKIGHGWRHAALILASGTAALVGIAVVYILADVIYVERFVLLGLDSWHPAFQYTSSIGQLMWVPNHALPGWWLAVLVLLHQEEEIDGATLALGIGASLLWTPLAVALVPLYLIPGIRRHLVSARMWMTGAVALSLLPVAVYLVAASQEIPYGRKELSVEVVILYLMFLTALIPHTLYIARHSKEMSAVSKPFYFISLYALIGLPWFIFGTSNDLVMRGSIVPLFVLFFTFGTIWLDPARTGVSRKAGWAVAILCSASLLFELGYNSVRASWAISDCSVVQASAQISGHGISPHYHAPVSSLPAWLIDTRAMTRRPVAERTCWDDPMLQRLDAFRESAAALNQLPPSTPGLRREAKP